MAEVIRCNDCLFVAFPYMWNEATQKVFGPDCTPIEEGIGKHDHWYICPECEERQDAEQLEFEDFDDEPEQKSIEFELIVSTGFISETTSMLHEIIEGLLGGVNYKTKDLLTAQAIDSALMLNRLTYVKNVYFDNGELAIEFSV